MSSTSIASPCLPAGFVAPYRVGFLHDLTQSDPAAQRVLAALRGMDAVLFRTFAKKVTALKPARA